MTHTERKITPQRFEQGLTYEKFLTLAGDNRQRFQESDAAFQMSAMDAHFFQDALRRTGPIKVLAIVEDWSPDVQRYLPVVARIAEACGMELRIFQRDKHQDIMNQYLNQGKYMSIPVFAFFDRDMRPVGHWTERPAAAAHFVEQVNKELAPLNLSVEAQRAERGKRSAPLVGGWRRDAVAELKQLVCSIPPRS